MTRGVRYLIGLVLLLGAIAPAHAVSYSSLYVFGDSLVDSGNAAIFTGYAEASPLKGYVDGRFSNGPNFADDLAVAIGASMPTPALIGGTNAAVGGSTAQSSTDPGNFSFDRQIDFLRDFVTPVIPGDALVLVTFGGNDVRETIAVGSPVDFSAAVADFATGLARLYDMGARNFVITGSPDIGLLPASVAAVGAIPGQLDALSDRSQDISTSFADQAAMLAGMAGTNVSFFDLLAYEHQLLADPAAFGLPADLNTTLPCWQPTAPATADCSKSLYFDPIHPTEQVHQAIANAIVAQLAVPEAATWMMMIVGFGGVGIGLRRKRRLTMAA